MVQLRPEQEEAIRKIRNGCILNGGTGSGKSITSIAYFALKNGVIINKEHIIPIRCIPDLYIITTAKKRNDMEWEFELSRFLMSTNDELNAEYYDNNIVVDSWNNIKKYENVVGAQFIFDEQHVKGYGSWTKSFLKIAKRNEWILLSATPGDTYSDYLPVFIANGFIKNKTEFNQVYCQFDPHCKNYPKIKDYIHKDRLNYFRRQILVDMNVRRKTKQHHVDIKCEYDKLLLRTVTKDRWNYITDEPIETGSQLCYLMRRVCNSDASRIEAVESLLKEHPRAIIFYNFDYELEMLEAFCEGMGIEYAEYNGHRHQQVPTGKSWVYLVNYYFNDGWNNTSTDTIIFFSQNYSYGVMTQAAGRIDRLNTMYTDLYYYHIKSNAPIDLAITRAIKEKRTFNESAYVRNFYN